MGQVVYIVPDENYQDDNKLRTELDNNSVRSSKSDNVIEIDLIQKIVFQDRNAFHSIFTLYYPRLQRFISRLTQRNELVEEIINDVMLVIWQKAGDFKNRSRVSTWIFGIAYNKTLKSIAIQSRHISSNLDEQSEDIDPSTPCSQLAQEQNINKLQQCLAQLSTEHQTVVVLTYIYGYSYPEISEIMECPVNTIKTRMFHARKKLQVLLPDISALNELENV